jgi:hypothetical protein
MALRRQLFLTGTAPVSRIANWPIETASRNLFHQRSSSMLKFGSALLVATTVAFGSTSAASAATAFDGQWSVVIQTTRGSCDQAYRFGLSIVNGNVTYAGGSADVRGRVARNGSVHVRVSSGSSYADGRGRLRRSSGSGVWRGVGSGVCSGRWYAERR